MKLLQGFLLLCVVVLSTFPRSATSGFVQVACSESNLYLPQPEQVNAFLALNKSLINPLLPSGSPLQVTRCRSDMTGPPYDFYQLADEDGCKSRPGMRSKRDDEYTPQEKFYLNQIPVIPYVILVWTIVLLIWLAYDAAKESRRDHPRHISELCTPAWGVIYSVLALIGIILGLVNFFRIVLIVTTVPVALPEPQASGLNAFLSSFNFTLYRCETSQFQFYVGLPDSCSQLGNPYVGVSAKARERLVKKELAFSFSLDSAGRDPDIRSMGVFLFLWILCGSVWTFATVPIALLEAFGATWHCFRWILDQRQGAARCHPVDDDDMEMTGRLAYSKGVGADP